MKIAHVFAPSSFFRIMTPMVRRMANAIKAHIKIYGVIASILALASVSFLGRGWLLSWLSDALLFSKRRIGVVLVVIGVVGEGGDILLAVFAKHFHERHKRVIEIIGAGFWMVLVIGLALEIPEAANVDRQTEELRAKNDQFEAKLLGVETNIEQTTNRISAVETNFVPWRINARQRSFLLEELKGIAVERVLVLYREEDESREVLFKNDVVEVLKHRFKTQNWYRRSAAPILRLFWESNGVSVLCTTGTGDAAWAVQRGFGSAGINTHVYFQPDNVPTNSIIIVFGKESWISN
ncbi:MAG TPA: hypothetical protein VNZ64_05320 [Candidatus Acidoferrum sp.]|nr:hypothetical protein [Candidatus Acidoferrum sp.]